MKPLRTVREAAGLTQHEFGQALGITQSHVSRLEGDEPISADVLAAVDRRFAAEMRRAKVRLGALLHANRRRSR